jgi:CTP synthase (UTP-ammonia lyase)
VACWPERLEPGGQFSILLYVSVHIALIGDEKVAYPSHRELNAVRPLLGADVVTQWLPTDGERISDLAGFHGIWLTPGSPYANDAAVYQAVRWARERDVPFLGTCGGLQYAVIEYFRNVLGMKDASHAESDGVADSNVISALSCGLQGQERLVRPVPGTRFCELTGGRAFTGTHYCSYGPGPAELRALAGSGLVIEATAPDADAEVIELPANRFFFLTLFQPQIGALAGNPPHPLLREFVLCSRRHSEVSQGQLQVN